MALAPYLQPFVLSVVEANWERHGVIDVYRPRETNSERRPVIVFIHGGPLPPDLQPTPREWPVYVGYGSLAADCAVVGVTVDHRLHDVADYPVAAGDVAAAVDQARTVEGVDADRVALWFFSGGGLLAADWLAAPPPWLRCIALTYPVLAPLPGWDVDRRFHPADALAGAGKVPILPIERNISQRHVSAREIVDHWAHARRVGDEPTVSRDQLDLSEWLQP